jgi:hypothetical protein
MAALFPIERLVGKLVGEFFHFGFGFRLKLGHEVFP